MQAFKSRSEIARGIGRKMPESRCPFAGLNSPSPRKSCDVIKKQPPIDIGSELAASINHSSLKLASLNLFCTFFFVFTSVAEIFAVNAQCTSVLPFVHFLRLCILCWSVSYTFSRGGEKGVSCRGEVGLRKHIFFVGRWLILIVIGCSDYFDAHMFCNSASQLFESLLTFFRECMKLGYSTAGILFEIRIFKVNRLNECLRSSAGLLSVDLNTIFQ